MNWKLRTNSSKIITWFIIVLVIIIGGCSPKQRYDRRVRQELASGVRYDSLLLGLNMGMTKKEFYTYCWELNKKGLIEQGTANTSVLYKTEDFKYSANMNFYPTFYEDKIVEMPIRINYGAWAPWNKHLSADSLQEKVLEYYKKGYGANFIQVRHPERGTAYVMVNGNRRISIYSNNEEFVWVLFTDLEAEKRAQESGTLDSLKLDTASKFGN